MTARFRSKSIASALAGGLTAVVIAGTAMPCAAQTPAQPARPTTPAQAQAPARTSAPPPVVAAPGVNVPPEFTIGADDVLSIVFWRDKELTAEVTVRPDGKISLPLLNDVQASGLTPSQLKDRIVDESKKYVEDPNVTVVVKQINSRKVFITGEVRKPGPYLLTGAMTVLQMISIAGGLADYAKPDKISVVRVENGKPVSFRFNYKQVIEGKKLNQNIELKPGDTIIVP
ncbi:MAG TPA: polysaccharide biosynthesis/export family protein [Vicinamibacterales bacterium]|nr:polysaccharide biosynthesis/export family protein [Vicinamibacterales bacterium]